ncbi:MAG: hypothetical protein LBL51_00950 [Synergistaceae bacterium]|jgi:hypothetical protein|nr:hypothetical protein [Synergistaceae bacterium]
MTPRKFVWLKLIFCSLLLGGLWRFNERYLWMSFRGFRIEVSDPALERRFWDVFPSRCLRFWPLFVRQSREIGAFLERTLPVLVDTRMTGLGEFSTEIRLLTPWLLVEWRGARWCVSREGRMWNTADESARVPGLELPRKPVWKFSSSSEALERTPWPGGDFPSIFSMGPVEDFLSRFGREPWFRDVQEVTVGRRAGDELFRLRFVRGRQEFVILIQHEKYEARELEVTLARILAALLEEGGSHLIDATYRNKIVVSALSAGGAERGSR